MAAESQLNPTQPVNQQIYRILRRDIVHCLIHAGTPLSRKSSCVLVCRQPVREAFIKLAETDLSDSSSAVAMSIKSHRRRCVMVACPPGDQCAVAPCRGMIDEQALSAGTEYLTTAYCC